ncbi:hypothetical protein VNO77_03654 [Canavalia gladiata]|uniref:Uncharacterized protein n=1 Tax=Canavalia gladiata TaxID=3824 RepID=A0AAN9N0S0_CANGL
MIWTNPVARNMIPVRNGIVKTLCSPGLATGNFELRGQMLTITGKTLEPISSSWKPNILSGNLPLLVPLAKSILPPMSHSF